jgi:hypothetical protein
MTHHQHRSEEELIEFHLDESADAPAIRNHLETCDRCDALSESIAKTLRVYSAEPVPEANLEHSWQRLRGHLTVLGNAPQRRFSLSRWLLPVGGVALTAIVLLLFITWRPQHAKPAPSEQQASVVRQGPLTAAPTDPLIAAQLESAERLLTEVNHTTGPLDESTRSQAHDLLLKNAMYIQSARQRGDLGTGFVLEDLGRVLTTIDHAPKSEDGGWHLRMEWNTKGLLLDIRILQQNDSRI